MLSKDNITRSINLIYLKLIVNVADPNSTERIEHAYARNPITMISLGKSILRRDLLGIRTAT